MVQTLEITRPDDWHCHLRDGEALNLTVKDIARYFGRAIVMPNLTPAVTTTAAALDYRERILAHIPAGKAWQPLMTLYLTDNTTPKDINQAKQSGHIYGAKLYPAGATTNSAEGVTNLKNIYDCLETMAQVGLPLLVHGEVTDNTIDIFDREKVFIDTHLTSLAERFPTLRIVLEHITTKQATEFVRSANSNIAATITAHHLLYNRNHMLVGGIRPHYYCLPILKRSSHQTALIEAATSGNPKFFLGTDSAPHPTGKKETNCGCAGCYTANAAIELYTEAFEQANALDKLEGFASFFGPDFYGLDRNSDNITLQKIDWTQSTELVLGNGETVTPLRAGEKITWQVVE